MMRTPAIELLDRYVGGSSLSDTPVFNKHVIPRRAPA